MAMDKVWKAINRKLDLIMDELGIVDDEANEDDGKVATRAPRELTAAEQQAIDNAPKAEASVPPEQRGPRVTQENAPDTSLSVPPDAEGNVTVETKQTDGTTTTQTTTAAAARDSDDADKGKSDSKRK